MKHLFTFGPINIKKINNMAKEVEFNNEFPNHWKVDKIGNKANFATGGTPNRSNSEYWLNGSIPWVKTGEIDYRIIEDSEEKITEKGLKNSSAKLFPAGTLLIALYGQGVTRGKVGILGIEASTNQACAAIFPNNDINKKYLFYYLEYRYNKLRSMSHGAQQKNLSVQIVKNFELLIPPLNEQNQISSYLEVIDTEIYLEKNKKNSIDELYKSMLYNLMTARIRVNDLVIPNGGK
jgi:type I restriction enzyme S subunit